MNADRTVADVALIASPGMSDALFWLCLPNPSATPAVCGAQVQRNQIAHLAAQPPCETMPKIRAARPDTLAAEMSRPIFSFWTKWVVAKVFEVSMVTNKKKLRRTVMTMSYDTTAIHVFDIHRPPNKGPKESCLSGWVGNNRRSSWIRPYVSCPTEAN